jgi:hypothetical protein
MKVKSGNLVDSIELTNSNWGGEPRIGGGGGGGPKNLRCTPPNAQGIESDGKIMGIKVRTGSLLDQIQLVCGLEQ